MKRTYKDWTKKRLYKWWFEIDGDVNTQSKSYIQISKAQLIAKIDAKIVDWIKKRKEVNNEKYNNSSPT